MPKIKTRLTPDEFLALSVEFRRLWGRTERLEKRMSDLETAVQGVAASEASLEARLTADQANRQATVDRLTGLLNDATTRLGTDDTLVQGLQAERQQAITELGIVQAKLDALDAVPVDPNAQPPLPGTDPNAPPDGTVTP